MKKNLLFNLVYALLSTPLLFSSLAQAKLQTGFKETAHVKSLSSPVTFAFFPDSPNILISEQTGELKVFKNGTLLDDLFLKLEVDSQGEHGVLGIVFDPQYASNHYVYIYYTATSPVMHNRVSRFTVEGDKALPKSEHVILDLQDILGSIYHSAGSMHFGIDGKLYIGVGENGGSPFVRNAQLLTNPFGKILRINSDGTFPTDNPFYLTADGIGQAIWALGLRNPFTMAFKPGTDTLFINDVGADTWEKIVVAAKGGNYGWPDVEGPSDDPRYLHPIFTYKHGSISDENFGCAITGGTFYNPDTFQFPESYRSKYFFVDYCNNWIKLLDPKDNSVTTFGKDLAPNPVSLTVGPDGSLYYISRWFKGIYKISYRATQAPSAPKVGN